MFRGYSLAEMNDWKNYFRLELRGTTESHWPGSVECFHELNYDLPDEGAEGLLQEAHSFLFFMTVVILSFAQN